jgi:hypothetical protein
MRKVFCDISEGAPMGMLNDAAYVSPLRSGPCQHTSSQPIGTGVRKRDPVAGHPVMATLALQRATDNWRVTGDQTMLKQLTLTELAAAKVAAPHRSTAGFATPTLQNNRIPIPTSGPQLAAAAEPEFAQLPVA